MEWVSPLEKDNYREHREEFLDTMGLSRARKLLYDFWPENGPQWDGLAWVRGKNLNGVLLVEAKSYPGEAETFSRAKDPKSVSLIQQSLARVQGYMGISAADWTKPYYQLANRLAFLYFLNVLAKIPAWLVLVNFVNDQTHVATSLEQWIDHYRQVFQMITLSGDNGLFPRIGLAFGEAK